MDRDATTLQLTSKIRPRAIFIGVLLAGTICLLTPVNNIYHRATPLGGGHFPLAPFFLFLVLALLVLLISRVFKSRVLITGSELLVMWMQMVIGSGIAYTGLSRTLFINLTAPIQFATTGNQWRETFDPLLPKGLMPSDLSAIEPVSYTHLTLPTTGTPCGARWWPVRL